MGLSFTESERLIRIESEQRRMRELLDLIAQAVRGIPGATWPEDKK
jgi:hypothetical protein